MLDFAEFMPPTVITRSLGLARKFLAEQGEIVIKPLHGFAGGSVFRIHLPALRERGDDVLLLADHFVRQLGGNMGKPEPGLSREARDLLVAHSWPGNIRELQNAIERALILAQGELISAGQLGIAPRLSRGAAPPTTTSPEGERRTAAPALADMEKQMIVEALRRANGNKSRAAAALGLSRTQLLRRVRRFGLDA